MKDYIFYLNEKKETLVSPTRKVEVNIDEIMEFDNYYGIERKWITLDNHNSIEKIKRLIIPEKLIMLTTFKTSFNSPLKDYLIYIDFGKYSSKNNSIEFIDLELDIIIKRDLKFVIDDMDELILEYRRKNIQQSDFFNVLEYSTFLINHFEQLGVLNTLKQNLSDESIEWLLNI